MKDEIKEMLQEIRETVDSYLETYKLKDDMMYDTINYKASQWYALLDSITNLQEENKDYKSRIEKVINFISKKIRDVALYGDQYFDLNELLQILQGVGKDE